MSGELALVQVSASQTGKETTINQATAQLEGAITGQLTLDGSTADQTLTLAQAQAKSVIIVTGTTSGRKLNMPACVRELTIWNKGANALAIVCGTTTLSLAAASAAMYCQDGTANGMVLVGTAAATGGSTTTDATAAHKYWRITTASTGNSARQRAQLGDLQFRQTAGTTVRPTGGTAIESGHYGSDVVANLYDSDYNTYWAASNAVASKNDWVGYNYGVAVKVVQVYMNDSFSQESDSDSARSGALQFSDDGVTWYQACTYSVPSLGSNTPQTFTNSGTTTSPVAP